MPPDIPDPADQPRLEGAPGPPAPTTTERGPTGPDRPADWIHVLRSVLLADLRVLPRLAADLPTGGIPQAGYLARHCYVLCEVIEHHVAGQRRAASGDRGGPTGSEPGGQPGPATEELGAALREVGTRIDRLYSAERPGELDHLEAHLSRLYRAARTDLRPPRARSTPDPPSDCPVDPRWWDGLGYRPRARIVAWASAADPTGTAPVARAQPLMTRLILAAGGHRRARRRAERLGLAREA